LRKKGLDRAKGYRHSSTMQTAQYLREKAQQCFSMANYHSGEAAEALNAMGREMAAKADELEGVEAQDKAGEPDKAAVGI
jgi:hypothetical protein